MTSWRRAVPLTALAEGRLQRVVVADAPLCVSLVDGRPLAVRDVCAHRAVALSGGTVRAGVVTCPGHAWQVDLRDGRCLGRPERVDAVACRVVDGWVEVHVPRAGVGRAFRWARRRRS